MSAESAPATAPPRVEQAPRPRIVQYRNRRYSIRLEPVFWNALDRMATRANMRLGRFIATLADNYDGGNFSSHLRTVCMVDGEQTLAQASLRPTRTSLLDVIEAAFTPALLLSRYRTILASNAAFVQWIAPAQRPADGADLTAVIQVRPRRPLNDVWLDLLSGAVTTAEANVLYVTPGRVLAAAARFVALPTPGEETFHAVLWIAPTQRPNAPAALPRPKVPQAPPAR
ncbi:MAG: hypothetical protein D6826_01650, partial [Alphaproteobacteria bacterium]